MRTIDADLYEATRTLRAYTGTREGAHAREAAETILARVWFRYWSDRTLTAKNRATLRDYAATLGITTLT